MKATTRAHLSVLFVNLLYAANFSIAKQVMPEFIKPFGFIVIRVIPATVLFFLSAFLLFQIQPMIGKFILPWFGGSPAVWTTCMLVFQVLLFGGYAYAHATTQYLPAGRQLLLHVGLLAFAEVIEQGQRFGPSEFFFFAFFTHHFPIS